MIRRFRSGEFRWRLFRNDGVRKNRRTNKTKIRNKRLREKKNGGHQFKSGLVIWRRMETNCQNYDATLNESSSGDFIPGALNDPTVKSSGNTNSQQRTFTVHDSEWG